MKRTINGVYTYSDSYLKKKNKSELIEYIRTIEKNWMNSEETNNIQYENCKRLLAEERNKAIDELVNAIKEKYPEDKNAIIHIEIIAEQLKKGEAV